MLRDIYLDMDNGVNNTKDNKILAIRISLFAALDLILVVYSGFFNFVEFGRHDLLLSWRSLPYLPIFIAKYWYIALVIPALCLIFVNLLRRRDNLWVRLLPDILLVYGILWLVFVQYAWGLAWTPSFVDLRGFHY